MQGVYRNQRLEGNGGTFTTEFAPHHVFMETGGKISAEGLEEAILQLRVWAQGQRLSPLNSDKVANLCNESFLLSQPVPRNWSRRGEFLKEEHCRYLWYCNVARLLRWRERRWFVDFMRLILNNYVLPTPNTDQHEVACTG